MTKICISCHIEKDISEFHKQKSCKYGVRTECKICRLIKIKTYPSQSKENIKKRNKTYWNKNKKELTTTRKIYLKEYCKINKKIISEKKKIYREKNREKINKNRESRKKNDICFRIRSNLASRLVRALKNNQKSGHTLELLGCSVEFLKKYLESQFKDGMGWDNWKLDGWHIDHIKPCSKFDLSKPEEQEKCFHYSNLQPLWAVENQHKSDN